MEIKIIGLGGVGTHLIEPLCRYLMYQRNKEISITLIDGDEFEEKNSNRQNFNTIGNKAVITAEKIKNLFMNLTIEAKPCYVTEENIFLFVQEGDIIFSCVDNHATRKLLSNYCQSLKNIILISGGNEYSDGNVQIYIRKEGKNIFFPLEYLHPEISNPKDRNPAEMSCEELAKSVPQLIFTNYMVSACMLSTFWLIMENKLEYSEQYFDLKTGTTRSVKR